MFASLGICEVIPFRDWDRTVVIFAYRSGPSYTQLLVMVRMSDGALLTAVPA